MTKVVVEGRELESPLPRAHSKAPPRSQRHLVTQNSAFAFKHLCVLELICLPRARFRWLILLRDWLYYDAMTTRLKRKLNDLGVDTASSKANESFCLVRLLLVSS